MLLFCLLLLLASCAAKGQNVLKSTEYHVTLQYSSAWKLVTNGMYSDVCYKGKDGFFYLNAYDGQSKTLKQVAAALIGAKMFGSRPKTKNIRVDGKAAMLIYPSADQIASNKNTAVFVMQYPDTLGKQFTFMGPFNYKGPGNIYFTLYADPKHILAITKTVRFF